jgi:hypothetical protein
MASSGSLDTDTMSPTYNTIINARGYCVPTLPSTTQCPPTYKKVGAGNQCRSCGSYCAECTLTGSNFSTATCSMCTDGRKFRYGYTNNCNYGYCYQSTTTTLRYKYPAIGLDQCGYSVNGDCDHVLIPDP